MELLKITKAEYLLCLVVWDKEPISSSELVRLCHQKYCWAKSTTFTVIRRLCGHGIIINNNSIISSLVSKDEVQTARLEALIDETFEGDISVFLNTVFCSSKFSSHELELLSAIVGTQQDNI